MSSRVRFAAIRALEIVLLAALVASVACGFDAAKPGGGDDGPAAPDASPVDACGDVPAAGACAANGREVMRCVDGRVEHETCAAACLADGDTARCIGPEVCAGIGPLGRCDGDDLWRCDGEPTITHCATTNHSCGYRDDVAGYGCVDATSASRVAGTIRWEDRPVSPGMLADPVAVPARGVMVAVLDDATNQPLATVSAADDGSYVAHYAAPAGTPVRVTAYSRSRAEVRPARVRDTAGYLHAVGSPVFAAGTTPTVDVLVTAASTAGGAFNALDNAVTAMDWIRARGAPAIAPVILYWQRTTASGSYYQSGTNELHLDGDDGFDDVVTLHELGHYMQDEYSDSDNPGGAHDGSPADPRLAWGEGGATWFAIAVRGQPYYMDWSTGGGWSVELEDRVHAASLAGALAQNISEWMVAELLWDLTDDASGDDAIAGSGPAVWDVLVGYLMSPQRQDRGRAGVDLVELLDGWFLHHGMSTCSAMRTLVRDTYHFPYDFSGPAGVCP